MIRKLILLIFILLFSTPLIMWLCWALQPKEKLVVAIVDKTVLNDKAQEHVSLNWLLNYHRYSKTSNTLYKTNRDYFGFFPLEKEQFKLKGLERFSINQVKALSKDADMVYFTDTYGIYKNEWYKEGDANARSGLLYGGLSDEDVSLLENMKAQKKLIITEFNCIGSPTKKDNKEKFEALFGIQWTGWVGRFFDSLDPLKNPEIPKWLINGYKRQNKGEWLFKKSGIALVNEAGSIVVLEADQHLTNYVPEIMSTKNAQEKFGLPETINYPFWFDIIEVNQSINTINASYKIHVNNKGKDVLNKYGIPAVFPAVTSHIDTDYQFYYFSGDFCDNPITLKSSYFKGIGFFKSLFYDNSIPIDRGGFFWNFYKPMVTRILKTQAEKMLN